MALTNRRFAIVALIFCGGALQLIQWRWGNVIDSSDQGRRFNVSDGSSVLCRGNSASNRFCHFKNICFSHSNEEFLFVHGRNTSIIGVPEQRYDPHMVLLSSSYDNENNFHYLDVTPEYFIDYPALEVKYMSGNYFVYSRVTPGNIMHIFHDEILPLFYTFLSQSELQDKSRVRLFAKDSSGANVYPSLYKMFTDHPPLYYTDLLVEPYVDLTCFNDLYVGLLGDSLWHQFGFKTPEGPIPNSSLTGDHIKLFTTHLKRSLRIGNDCPDAEFGIVFSRKKNRLILNEELLADEISKLLGFDIIELSLDKNSIYEIIEKVSCSKMTIGVHGAILVLNMFLPPGSVFVEIFPFAINPEHRRHYKTLVELPGMDVEYVSWRNMDRTRSRFHPTNDPRRGGIEHLALEEQQRIVESTEVAHSKKSSDPEWRYYLFQDTLVDIPAVTDVLTSSQFWKNRQIK